MSKKEVLKAEEAVEVMQATGVPAQETEGVGAVMATEIIADLKKQLEEAKEEGKNGKKVGICVVSRFEHCPGSQILLVWC